MRIPGWFVTNWGLYLFCDLEAFVLPRTFLYIYFNIFLLDPPLEHLAFQGTIKKIWQNQTADIIIVIWIWAEVFILSLFFFNYNVIICIYYGFFGFSCCNILYRYKRSFVNQACFNNLNFQIYTYWFSIKDTKMIYHADVILKNEIWLIGSWIHKCSYVWNLAHVWLQQNICIWQNKILQNNNTE